MRVTLAAIGRIGAMAILGLQAFGFASAAPLDADIQKTVQDATFEVVIPKPTKESITYDKPWQDLLPYQIRSDKYVSIGTAFSIGSGRYVSAMHVLFAVFGDARGEPMLRDAAGKVYPIAKIVKGSAEKDFVVFTLAQAPDHSAALAVDEAPELNETVYAVGNALGEGVVVREGNYTSDTPEDENGRWKWMRFSAPISGGNSGGPLVDSKGHVIGVVRAKRTTENTLNFAVPISLVTKAADNVISTDSRAVTGFFVFDKTKTAQFKSEIAGPKSFAEFSTAYMKAADAFNAAQLHALFADNAAEIFPHGGGSARLMRSPYERSAPAVIMQNSNGNWAFAQLQYTRLDLGHDGWQDSTNFKGVGIFHRHKPDNIDQAKWYADAQLAKDAVFASSPASIHLNGDTAKIVSIGKPDEDEPFTDVWGRVWRIRTWHVTSWAASETQVEFSLPVPDGTVGFEGRIFAIGHDNQLARLKLLTGFIAVSYDGKLSQWSGFLAQAALLPRQLNASVLKVDYGRRFAFDDHRLAFAYGPELQKIEADSRLRVDFGFMPGADGTVLDIGGVVAYSNDDKSEAAVFRHAAPTDDAGEEAKKDWNKRLHREHPYDAVALNANGRQQISTILGTPEAQPTAEALYTFRYAAEGGTAQEAMKAKLDLLTGQAKVSEH